MEKNIKMFMASFGIILGEYVETNEYGQQKIKEPLMMRMEGQEGGQANFAPILMNVEWCWIPADSMEIECHNGFARAYEEARQGIFSKIIKPTANEAAKILGV